MKYMNRKLFRRKFCRKIVAPVAAAMSCVSVSNVSRATDNFDLTNVTLKDKVIEKFKDEDTCVSMTLSDFCSNVLNDTYWRSSSRLKAIKEVIKKQNGLGPNADISLRIEVEKLSNNAYGKDVEPNVPSKNDFIIPSFQKLSSIIGKERVVWRYDPIFINENYTIEYHKK